MRGIFSEFATERGMAVFFGAILILTLLGPFGSYQAMSLGHRFAFWSAAITCVAVPMHVAMHFAIISPRLAHLPRIAQIAIGAAVAAVPGAALIHLITAVLWPSASVVADLPITWLQVMAVGFVIGCFHFLELGGPNRGEVSARPLEASAPVERQPADDAASEAPRFFARLDPGMGREIISLTMQDHYVEVTTTRGTQMVLIRFSDALDELAPLDGLRLHRSHWAVRDHVTGLVREAGKLRATLSDGRSLPVSRTYAPELRRLFDG